MIASDVMLDNGPSSSATDELPLGNRGGLVTGALVVPALEGRNWRAERPCNAQHSCCSEHKTDREARRRGGQERGAARAEKNGAENASDDAPNARRTCD
jgi:hypothetical protein